MTPHENRSREATVIPSISDPVADSANLAAIDSTIKSTRYSYIVAWGKWLGFTPASIKESIAQAEADDASPDVIQKIDGEWLTLDDIVSQSNRTVVEAIAATGTGWTR
jgi:hypothetical protein